MYTTDITQYRLERCLQARCTCSLYYIKGAYNLLLLLCGTVTT